MSEAVLSRLSERFGDSVLETGSHAGDEWARIAPGTIREVCTFLRDEPELEFQLPIDLTAVDFSRWDGGRDPRFDVVYHLYSVTQKHRIRLKVGVAEDDPVVPSVTDLYPGLGWFEREAWDMFGIRFEGHPDPRRMLMWEGFEGHPLRKDFPHRRRQERVPMRDLSDADVRDPAAGPQAQPPRLSRDAVWRGEETPAPAKPQDGIPGLPGPDGTPGGQEG